MTKRTLIFCFDGTWNGRDDDVPTNILRLHLGMDFPNQISFYFPGPGNEDENGFFMELLGGAFGLGSDGIRDQGLAVLKAAYQPGDRIAVLGFSRGAAIARMFCASIAEDGVGEFMPEIEFLGCFDTVGAYLPIGPSQQGLFHDLHVSSKVKSGYHAVAMDEDRAAFIPNLMNQRQGIIEVWFPGCHCDVGGGLEETGHSDTVLNWMIDVLSAHGVFTDIPTFPNPDAPLGYAEGHYRREARRVGVKVDDEWSATLDPILHVAS